MEQVEAKQRIKVATKDHVLISRLHLKLHFKLYSEYLPYAIVILLIFLAIVASTVRIVKG